MLRVRRQSPFACIVGALCTAESRSVMQQCEPSISACCAFCVRAPRLRRASAPPLTSDRVRRPSGRPRWHSRPKGAHLSILPAIRFLRTFGTAAVASGRPELCTCASQPAQHTGSVSVRPGWGSTASLGPGGTTCVASGRCRGRFSISSPILAAGASPDIAASVTRPQIHATDALSGFA